MKATVKGNTDIISLLLSHPNIDVNIQNKVRIYNTLLYMYIYIIILS